MPTPTRKIDRPHLLDTRICDLSLAISGTFLGKQVVGLYDDLRRAGLASFQPRIYWGDEWFSPQGVPAIAVPFYLADARLLRLEARVTRRAAEGGTPTRCRMLLRHEAGHCFDHAYRISESKAFARVFGDPARPYDPDAFKADRRTTDFVRHLPGRYAQAHPDEDFAETFAVLLSPTQTARAVAGGSRIVAKKLRFISNLIEKWGSVSPLVADDGSTDYAATQMRSTLRRHYERRQQSEARASRRRQSLKETPPSA